MNLRVHPDRLRWLMAKAVLSPKELAEQAGLSERRVYTLLDGSHRGMRPKTARAIAKVLGCEVPEFADWVERQVSA